METSSVIYAENTGISLPSDSWKIIIEYLNRKDLGPIMTLGRDRGCWFGFGSILPYRAINKMFSNMILECIKEVKIVLDHSMNLREVIGFDKGSNNYFLKKSLNIFNVICGCKELRSLHVSVVFSTSFGYSDHTVDHNKFFERLQQIGNDCKHIEDLCIITDSRKIAIKKLPLFPNLRKLSLKNSHVLPPDNMQDLMNLRVIEGDLLEHQWAHAISKLPNLIEIIWHADVIVEDEDILDFCNRCKENSICTTLEVFSSNGLPHQNVDYPYPLFTDKSLCVVLDTFPNLRVIKIHGSSITLTGDILQKIGNLTQLKVLRLNHSHMFSSAGIFRNTATNNHFQTIYRWLENSLSYFPKSLEIVEFSNCGDLHECHRSVTLNNLKIRIEANFHDVLPNLREINVSFCDNDDDSDDYGTPTLIGDYDDDDDDDDDDV
jgi:hypothetical protein